MTRDESGFTVAWDSPSSGPVTFGSTAPFTVDGDEQVLGDYPRHESQWGTVEHLATEIALRSDTATLRLDVDPRAREVGLA